MTRFEWMRDCGLCGVQLGMIGADVYSKYIRYIIYLEYIKAGKEHTTAITLTAERTRVTESTIYRALEFFAKPCENKE